MITPIAVAILPKMVKFSEKKDIENLSKLFHINSFVLSSLATSGALVLLMFTKDFILIWTHDEGIANIIENVTKILLLGSVFLSFQFMPYYLAIANGHTKTNVQLGAVSLILIIPTLYFLVKSNGIIGAAYTWLIFNFVTYFYLGYFLIGKFLKEELNKWLIYDTILPLVINICVGIIAYYIFNNLPKGLYVLLYSAMIVIISLLLNLFVFSKIYPKYDLFDFIGLKKLNS
jgi:O-antigen/teichoic acid export membrane protein